MKKKITLTKSKLGTTKPLTSKTRRLIKSKYGSTSTLPYNYPMYPFPKTSFLEKLWNSILKYLR